MLKTKFCAIALITALAGPALVLAADGTTSGKAINCDSFQSSISKQIKAIKTASGETAQQIAGRCSVLDDTIAGAQHKGCSTSLNFTIPDACR